MCIQVQKPSAEVQACLKGRAGCSSLSISTAGTNVELVQGKGTRAVCRHLVTLQWHQQGSATLNQLSVQDTASKAILWWVWGALRNFRAVVKG